MHTRSSGRGARPDIQEKPLLIVIHYKVESKQCRTKECEICGPGLKVWPSISGLAGTPAHEPLQQSNSLDSPTPPSPGKPQ